MRRSHSRLFAALALLLAGEITTMPARGQQGGSDIGGQPARRKVTKMPRLVKFIEAEYPEARRARGEQATVVLTIAISATGQVTNVSVAESAGADFDAAAMAAAKGFAFEPAEVDDKPAASKITYRYSFILRDETPKEPAAAATEPERAPTPAPTGAPAASEPIRPPQAVVEEVEVRGRARPRREATQYTVRAEQAKKVPGTQGDVLKVVQNLPGVSRPPVASGQIVVWGSAPRDTRVYVDGVDLPALYHGSGLRSTINSDLVSSVDLIPGAFGAEYGRGLGGLVRVETRPLPRGTHGYVGADTLDGSAFASTEVSSRVRIGSAFRYGWLDRVLALASAPDVGDFFPVPRYHDAQLKATIDLRRREGIDAVFLYSADDLARTMPSADPAKTRVESSSSGYWRAYTRYTYASEEGDSVVVTPFVGQDRSRVLQRFGDTPAKLDIASDRYGLRSSLRSRVADRVTLVVGVDALGTSSRIARSGSLTLPAREGDVAVFGQPPGDELAGDSWSTHIVDLGPHAFVDVRLGPVTVTPGARFDAYLIEGSRRTPRVGATPAIGYSRLEMAVAPRASARWQVTPRFALTAAYGNYHQPPEPEELSAVFGTPDLALSRATHVTLGESLRITSTLSADVVAFHKTMRDLVTRSRLTNPLVARALTQNGEGRSYGVQLLLRQELWKGFFGWVSYAITKSERRFEGDESFRAFDFDQPHVLSVVASQEIGRFTVGARFRYATGNPRTPVIGSVFDARNDRFDPAFGPHNTLRIPAFWQLDVRVERSFRLASSAQLIIFCDAQNVTNRQNAEEIVYSADYTRQGKIDGLPFIAVAGVRLEF